MSASRATLWRVIEGSETGQDTARLAGRSLPQAALSRALAPADFCGQQVDLATRVICQVNVVPLDFEALRGLDDLRELRLEWTDPHRRPLGLPLDLAPLGELPALAVLHLPRQAIVDLSALGSARCLEDLDLSHTEIRGLNALRGLTSLRRLVLHATRVDDISALASLSGLAELDLSFTRVRTLESLRSLHSLARLDLRGTDVSAQELEGLEAALPGLEVRA